MAKCGSHRLLRVLSGLAKGARVMGKRIMQAVACALGISLVAIGVSSAQTALSPKTSLLTSGRFEWAQDVTVLAIAPDGSWGTATEPLIDQARAKAITNCKTRYRRKIGCGYR